MTAFLKSSFCGGLSCIKKCPGGTEFEKNHDQWPASGTTPHKCPWGFQRKAHSSHHNDRTIEFEPREKQIVKPNVRSYQDWSHIQEPLLVNNSKRNLSNGFCFSWHCERSLSWSIVCLERNDTNETYILEVEVIWENLIFWNAFRKPTKIENQFKWLGMSVHKIWTCWSNSRPIHHLKQSLCKHPIAP